MLVRWDAYTENFFFIVVLQNYFNSSVINCLKYVVVGQGRDLSNPLF